MARKKLTPQQVADQRNAGKIMALLEGRKNNIKPSGEKTTWHGEYINRINGYNIPYSTRTLSDMAIELADWALNDPDALVLSEFWIKKGVGHRQWELWLEQSEELRETYALAKAAVGIRREKGGIRKKFSESMVHHSMAMYSPEWKGYAEWRAQLKAISNEGQNHGPTFILLKDMPVSDLVPDRVIEAKEESEL